MDDQVTRKIKPEPAASPASSGASAAPRKKSFRFALRREIPRWKAVFFGMICVAICFGFWWYFTQGETIEARKISSAILPSPTETFRDFDSLWFDRYLAMNACTSLRRVMLGFAFAAMVGVPLGVLCGCYSWSRAFLAPLTIFGRNIPIAALISLTFLFFGTSEFQKIMFIFIACVAFIIDDTATAIHDVSDRYVDTAYTLGANQWQIIMKVIFPLALPNIFNSLRLLFGIAFGYIMLAEVVRAAGEYGGLGNLITMSERQGPRTHIYLILLIIPILALAIDRLLFWVQRQLFPYQYGGMGLLRSGVGAYLQLWENFKSLFRKPVDYNLVNPPQIAAATASDTKQARSP
jgi:ABC-type nitrate/sulfonate/bicarbonate transport system permease component